ncbi:MAG: signal peptidase I [Firmicutes bacterium]|nr:signal peptidase I [Bacillota bacterium]
MDENIDVAPGTKQEQTQRCGCKFFQVVSNIIFAILLLLMATIIFAWGQSRITGKPPNIAGYQMYVVLGGSMSPTFEMGSIAFLETVDASHIATGDIITFSSPADVDKLTTHRVMTIHQEDSHLFFTTRGDANDVNDLNPVLAQNVVGRVVFSLPYLGYILHWGRSKVGLVALIILPGLVIIIVELRNLLRYAREWRAQREQATPNEDASAASDSTSEHNPC